MNLMPVILWTDIFVALLLLGTAALIWVARQSEPLRHGWRQVARRPAGMAAAAILACFALIGLLDSLHYRVALPPQANAPADAKTQYGVEVFSALDALLSPLRLSREKTYSAPLATRLYNKETIDQPDGTQRRDYPRLKHGGKHLDDESDRDADVALRILTGTLGGGVAAVLLIAGVVAGIARQQRQSFGTAWTTLWAGQRDAAWRAFLLTLGIILVLSGIAIALSGGYHVLGTEKVGQDVLYLTLKSIRTALVIGLVTTLVLLPVAVLLGILAGYFRGWVDDVIQYLYTTLNSIPGVLLIAAAVLMMQVIIDTHPQWFATAAERADVRLLALCLILGMTSWTGLCRVLRGETLKLAQLDYIQAAHAFGVAHSRIVRRHLLPNLMHIVLIAVVMDFSGLVLAEAVLSYVGIGVDASTISFGTMINNARMELAREPAVWWSLLAAFSFMFVLVLAANLFADAVRDAFDPRVAGSHD